MTTKDQLRDELSRETGLLAQETRALADNVSVAANAARDALTAAMGARDGVAALTDRVLAAEARLLELVDGLPDAGPDPDPPVVTFPGQRAPRHPRIREFDTAGAVRVDDPNVPLQTVVARNPGAKFFLVSPGDWRVDDVRCLKGHYFLGREGAERTRLLGSGYCFRAKDPTCDDVTIGGFTIQGFCAGSTNALAAAVSPRWSDTLFRTSEQDWYGGQPSGWVLHDAVLLDNGPNGFSMGDNGAAIRVLASGHTKTGIGLDRVRGGGLIDGCTLQGNSLAPATGELADGGDFKGVFVNGTAGLTEVESGPFLPPAVFRVAASVFRAKDPRNGKGGKGGPWFDLDSQLIEVDGCEFHGYEHFGLAFEICTGASVTRSLFRNCVGYGRALGDDFVAGALTIRETCWARAAENRFEGCAVPIVVGLSNRTSDLLRPPKRPWDVSYAWRGDPWANDPAQRREWIDPEYRRANLVGAMSNLATAEVDIERNQVDSGRVMINAGSIKGGQDPQAAMRALLPTVRFRGNTYGVGVRFDELERQGMTLAQWQERGRSTGWQRDQ